MEKQGEVEMARKGEKTEDEKDKVENKGEGKVEIRKAMKMRVK